MKRLILMIQFLTRIPIPVALNVTDEDFTKGFKYFPVVGSIIGGLIYAIHFLLRGVMSPFTGAVIITLAYIYITGGLHMDGLSDSADGLFSGRSKERILEIMKDSRIGSNGALAMMFVVLMKVSFMSEIPMAHLGYVLFLMPIISKYTVVFVSTFSAYAREGGMGNWFIGRVSKGDFIFSSLFTVTMIYLVNPNCFILLGGTLIFGWIFRAFCNKQIDGMTGDTIGALSELSDVMVLLLSIFLL